MSIIVIISCSIVVFMCILILLYCCSVFLHPLCRRVMSAQTESEYTAPTQRGLRNTRPPTIYRRNNDLLSVHSDLSVRQSNTMTANASNASMTLSELYMI